MSATAKKRYQNTTLRIPNQTYEKAKRAASRAQIASFNEFVIQAVVEKVRRLTEAEMNAAFAGMAEDTDYQQQNPVPDTDTAYGLDYMVFVWRNHYVLIIRRYARLTKPAYTLNCEQSR